MKSDRMNHVPDDRYQSSHGLLADVSRCASSLNKFGWIDSFEIGLVDRMSQFRVQPELYGHERELAYM